MDRRRWVLVAWRWGWVVGIRSRAGWERLVSQACHGMALVCLWWWDPALVFLVSLVPGWCPQPCPVAHAVCACWPLPAAAGLSSSRACDRPVLPSPVWGRAGLTSCGCHPQHLLASVFLRWGGAWGALCVWGSWGPPVHGGRVFSLAGLWLLGVCRWSWA